MNKLYEDYIREKVHERLIELAKRMLEDNILSTEKVAEYSGLELAEILDLQMGMKNKNDFSVDILRGVSYNKHEN